MQNKYVGDIGDFGKYGLLRFLFLKSPLILGINWCLVTDETDSNDGKYISYLCAEKGNEYIVYDSWLYQELHKIVKCKKRKVSEIKKHKILGSKTIFFESILDVRNRIFWHNKGLETLIKCDVIYFDPDNGLQIPSCKIGIKQSKKYICYDEIASYYNRGQSVIMYNHRDRKPINMYLERFIRIKDYVNIDDMFYLRFHRYSVRDYLFLIHEKHKNEINEKIALFLKSEWGKIFDYSQL